MRMYRILRSQYIHLQNYQATLKQTNTRRLCSYCKFYHCSFPKSEPYMQIQRNITTKRMTELHAPVKKKTRLKQRKYAELLEVKDNATVNKKTTVKTVRASELSSFVKQSDVPVSATRNNDMATEPDLQQAVENEVKEQIHEADSSKSKKWYKMQQKKKNEENKSKEDQLADSHKKDVKYAEILSIHIDIYVRCGMIDKAHKTLLKYWRRYKTKQAPVEVQDYHINMCNTILEGFSNDGKTEAALNFFELIKQNSGFGSPNMATIALMYEILRKSLTKKHDSNIIGLLKDLELIMNNKKISFNDIFNNTPFKKTQQENILSAIRILHPEYEPSYTYPNMKSVCNLVDKVKSPYQRVSPAEGINMTDEMQTLLHEQITTETSEQLLIKNINIPKELTPKVLACRKRLEELEEEWSQVVSKSFDKNLYYLEEREKTKEKLIMLHPFLKVLDKQQYVNAIMQEIRSLYETSESFSQGFLIHCNRLGKRISKKHQIQAQIQDNVLDKLISVYLKYVDWYFKSDTTGAASTVNNRTKWQELEYEMSNRGASLNAVPTLWPYQICLEIGKFLYKIILNDIIIDVNHGKKSARKRFVKAFYTVYRRKKKHLEEQIKPHPYLFKLLKDSHREFIAFEATDLPSLIPPRPWTTVSTGGYLLPSILIIRRNADTMHEVQYMSDTPIQKMYPILDSLNQLSSVPWRINNSVLDVLIEVFRNGGSEELDVPRPPSILPPITPLSPDASPEERADFLRMSMEHKAKEMQLYSLWCEVLYRLCVANHFRNRIFWLPHNIDFRGRVYPIAPHLNHFGADLARSLLMFANVKPLGPKGMDWLKIHCINLTGTMKRDVIKERLKYANEILDKIVESGEHPLDGEQWWTQSENPWQTLAVCMEIATALKSPNVEEYLCGFPVHQDGSCNGLQHYAALGRDEIGAKSVNLTPAERPQDVYTAVTELVEQQRIADAKNGIKIAELLEGHVKRKVVKQTVMTTVYGVTRFGAKQQIAKQLRNVNFSEDTVWEASMYLVDKTFYSLRTMFTSAREIQDWFTKCARTISISLGRSVQWVTPLGLPVVQPYYKLMHGVKKPVTMKQKNAFPPNYIHSLDSSHMMLTSIYCENEGIMFASVHDCYWTHPCTVEIMNRICREQFVALHSEPLLENLSEFFVQIYLSDPDKPIDPEVQKCFSKIPRKGQFDLQQVLSSVYFFS